MHMSERCSLITVHVPWRCSFITVHVPWLCACTMALFLYHIGVGRFRILGGGGGARFRFFFWGGGKFPAGT